MVFVFYTKKFCVLCAKQQQVKPDVEIYETLLKKYQLTADECVFIDDRMENIEGAEKAGIHGICFETIGQVKEDLKKYNIYV